MDNKLEYKNKLEDAEYQLVNDNLTEIEEIITTHSMFHLSTKLKTEIIPIGTKHKWISCRSCSGAIYAGIVKIYSAYIEDKNHKDAEVRQTKNNKKRKKPDKAE